MKSVSGRKAALALRSLCISKLLMIGKGGWLNFHHFHHVHIFIPQVDIFFRWCIESSLEMITGNLNKFLKTKTITTTASKLGDHYQQEYNSPFRTSLYKIFKNFFQRVVNLASQRLHLEVLLPVIFGPKKRCKFS